jgi:hypothetical protein
VTTTTKTADGGVERLYRAPTTPEMVDVPELSFLMIDGHGDPNTSERYGAAIAALYGVAYTLKFSLRKAGRPSYRVAPLEGLWWADDMAHFGVGDKSDWHWRMMLRQPDEIDDELVERTAREVSLKKGLPTALDLRLEHFAEGRAAQVLYVGPFADEGPTIARLHAFIEAQGLARRGRHHEIYLTDPRRRAPEKWKTIIRQPVAAECAAVP